MQMLAAAAMLSASCLGPTPTTPTTPTPTTPAVSPTVRVLGTASDCVTGECSWFVDNSGHGHITQLKSEAWAKESLTGTSSVDWDAPVPRTHRHLTGYAIAAVQASVVKVDAVTTNCNDGAADRQRLITVSANASTTEQGLLPDVVVTSGRLCLSVFGSAHVTLWYRDYNDSVSP